MPGNTRAIGEAYNFAGEYALTTDCYMRTITRVVGDRFGSEPGPGGGARPEPEVIYYNPRSLGMDAAAVRPVYPYRWGEHVVRDMSKTQLELGYSEAVGLEEGLRRSLDWYLGEGRAECGFVADYAAEDKILARLHR